MRRQEDGNLRFQSAERKFPSRFFCQSAFFVFQLALFNSLCLSAGNLVRNGSFERGNKHPDYWHVQLTDFMPKKQAHNPRFTSYRYICGCGNDLGDVKPWCGLICPKCGGFIGGEECGAWYLHNHERVSLGRGRSGRAIKFTLPPAVGNNQGVRAYSHLIKAKRGWGYKISFDAKTRGSHARVFVECYRFLSAPKSALWDGRRDPSAPKRPIERSYRAPVNCGSPSTWTRFSRDIVAPKRYRFDYMTVKLYVYLPGEAWFDNVAVRPMTARELRSYLSRRKVKDKRFEY